MTSLGWRLGGTSNDWVSFDRKGLGIEEKHSGWKEKVLGWEEEYSDLMAGPERRSESWPALTEADRRSENRSGNHSVGPQT